MSRAQPLFDRPFVSPETYDAFFSVIGRLEAGMRREIDVLKSGQHTELADVTRQKQQGFLELNRIMTSIEQSIPSQDIMARLAAFRSLLDANSKVLSTHLKAAQEVTGIIMRVLRDAESDGTYSAVFAATGYEDA